MKKIIISKSNNCDSCGQVIPEGKQYCGKCYTNDTLSNYFADKPCELDNCEVPELLKARRRKQLEQTKKIIY